MFKASIALVLLAFGALAYGWIAGNDIVLYGSIGASALAGLALLRSTMTDRKAGYPGSELNRAEPAERPARERRGPKSSRIADSPPAPPKARRKSSRLDPDALSNLDLSSDDEEELPEQRTPSVKPFIPAPGRERRPRAPAKAAWATEDDFGEESEPGEESYDRDQVDYDSGFAEEQLPEEDLNEPVPSAQQGAAADDFRSRLAAVLGPAGDQEQAPPPPPATRTPRARRTPPAPAAADVEAPKPVRRGRKKAMPVLAEPEGSRKAGEEEADPEWVRIDDLPRISRATPPGGGLPRPDAPQGITPYRPRRGASQQPSGEKASTPPASPRRRTTAAGRTGAEPKPRPTAAKRPAAGSKPSVTKAADPTKPRPRSSKVERDPDAPPPRRGRPPKPKP